MEQTSVEFYSSIYLHIVNKQVKTYTVDEHTVRDSFFNIPIPKPLLYKQI